MSSNRTIVNLQKQNDSIYQSLVSKNINFSRIDIDKNLDESEQLRLLGEENLKLKELIKSIKPIKPVQSEQTQNKKITESKQNSTVKSNSTNKSNDSNGSNELTNLNNVEELNDEETFVDPIKKFDTIANMEEIKRAFFNGEYGEFEEKLKLHSFKYFKANYKYNSDKDGAPEYSATNLLKGFVRNFDDYRKYFLICFRCWKSNPESNLDSDSNSNSNFKSNTYFYNSYWIVNSNEPIQNIIGQLYDEFEFEEINDFDLFFNHIVKKLLPDCDNYVYSDDSKSFLIGENYVH